MFAKIIRIFYSLSYFSLLALIAEGVNIKSKWDEISFYWNSNIIEGMHAFCVIHYPLLILLLMLLVCSITFHNARITLAHSQLKVLKSSNIGLDSFFQLGQIVPLLTLTEKLLTPSFSSVILAITVLILWPFFASYGSFNMSLYIMQYHQYKISTNSSEYWLVSKRKIRDFSQSFTVVEISNKILLRI